MTTTDPAAPGRRQRRRWLGLAVLALPALLASLELTVTNLALPAIARDLSADSTQLLWTVDVYAFLLAGSLITMGVLGDLPRRLRPHWRGCPHSAAAGSCCTGPPATASPRCSPRTP